MNRNEALTELKSHAAPFDIVIIGGGATGLGCAVDAASRGHSVALIEQADFAKGTSSRSTKLVHGGVRYLKQGNISLVLEALKERGRLCLNAPHLVTHQSFIVPIYKWWDGPFYGIGLKVYDMLAGKLGLKPSKQLNKKETLEHIPTLETDGLQGGVIYYDGQFDDSRLAINLAQTVFDHGGLAINYIKATGFEKQNGLVVAVHCQDCETDDTFTIQSKTIINATGVFTDSVRRMDNPDTPKMISASQGVHLVLPKEFVPGDAAVMVPQTTDGRVLFAVPWHEHVVVGTTDTPVESIDLEPVALEEEVEFILKNAAQYLAKDPQRSDVLSVFAGLRPLVQSGEGDNTSEISRDHTIVISDSGLLTIAGGKWTTYRNMAEDAINQAETLGGLDSLPCKTVDLPIHGSDRDACPQASAGEMNGRRVAAVPTHFSLYGSDSTLIQENIQSAPSLGERIHPALPYTKAEALWSIRYEMARRAEDVLARRTRMLFLNAQAAYDSAELVAELLAKELGHSQEWVEAETKAFRELAKSYLLT
ncbi:MAG: FAD-dependent oxidoreductase [Opitutaceae bacterium]